MRTRTTRLVLFTLTSLILIHLFCLHCMRRAHVTFFHYNELQFPDSLPSANSTLGFGGIFAVSHADSPRRSGLLWAAELTDIDVIIPRQKIWTDRHLEEFKAKNESIISKGSALAWLGHLNALKWFLSTDLETALILEDDSDWDIRLRTSQVPLLAAALRTILPGTLTPDGLQTSNSSSTTPKPPKHSQQHENQETKQDPDPDFDPHYWGPIPSWDLLYLGHCDDIVSISSPLAHAHALYPDATVPPHPLLHPDTANFLRALAIPEGHRFVHRSRWPLCTFAYGVNRRSAQWILDRFSTEEEGHGTSAFDVRLLEACRDMGWKCWSVAPELFHHVEGESEIWSKDVSGTKESSVENEVGSGNAGDEIGSLSEGSGAGMKTIPEEHDSSTSTSTPTSSANPETQPQSQPQSPLLTHQQQSQTFFSPPTTHQEYGTWNIRCGARHPQLRLPVTAPAPRTKRDDTDNDNQNERDRQDDKDALRTWVRNIVQKGECPIDFSKEESAFSGCEGAGCGGQS